MTHDTRRTEAMKTHRVAVIPGDGIGKEVVPEGLRALEAAAARHGIALEFVHFDWDCDRYVRTGRMMPEDWFETLSPFEAIFYGAVGWPAKVPDHVSLWGSLIQFRRRFDQYVNLRPCRLMPGIATPLANRKPGDIDFIVVRENTEGTYAGEGGFLRHGTPHEIATQGSVNTRMGVERCVRFAFELADSRERKHLTLVHKTNVLTFAGDLWQRTFDDVAREFGDVGVAYNHVDAACIYFVQDPGRYDVIVTDNLFGDILTDLGGAIGGGIGRAASANLNPARTGPSLFEPVHGSAPDIAGKGVADPRAAVISAAMMCEFLGEADAATRIRKAVEETDDKEGSTTQIGDAIAAAL
jgi:tartrate dehydrogenase